MMSLGVIIPTYNRVNDLDRLLNSLYLIIGDINQLIVVIGPSDSNSIDLCNKWKSKLPIITIIEISIPSVITAINTGLSIITTDIICLLDDDVVVSSNWAKRIKERYTKNIKTGAYGGRDILMIDEYKLANPSPADKVGVYSWGTLIGNHHCGLSKSPQSVDVIKGANFSFLARAFPKLLVDEKLIDFGAEVCWEIDICLSIKKNGYDIVYDNDNYVFHYVGQRTKEDERTSIYSKNWYSRIHNESYIIAKFRSLPEILIYSLRTLLVGSNISPGIIKSILLVGSLNNKILYFPFKKISPLLSGLIHGLKNRFFM